MLFIRDALDNAFVNKQKKIIEKTGNVIQEIHENI